ncbi:MAG: DUF4381 domain-containing protein [Gammaproteobacteria bacterium]|nr:DUF4381 domain-containing protein [Gammaproteobacteria bacterium]
MNELPLRDIHLPDPVSWWPPAIGWWLILIAVILLVLLIPRFIRWLKHKPLNKLAQNEFSEIKERYQQHQDSHRLLRELSVLLRRVAMSYNSRQNAASLTGEQWLQHLNTLTTENYFSTDLQQTLTLAPYAPKTELNIENLLLACESWFQHLPKEAVHHQGRQT